METFEEYCTRRKAENAAKQTDPPTEQLGRELGEGVEYHDGAVVQWVCKCGSKDLDVFYVEGHYQTFAKCRACGFQDDIHTG